MISICHAQHHSNENYKHVLIVTPELNTLNEFNLKFLTTKITDEGVKREIMHGDQLIEYWVISMNYANKLILKKLLRTVSKVFFIHNTKYEDKIMKWIKEFETIENEYIVFYENFKNVNLSTFENMKLVKIKDFEKYLISKIENL